MRVERKKELNIRRDFFVKLQSNLISAEQLFETNEVKRTIRDFRAWYDDMVKKEVPIEVEPDKPVVEKRKKIVEAMGAELGKPPK